MTQDHQHPAFLPNTLHCCRKWPTALCRTVAVQQIGKSILQMHTHKSWRTSNIAFTQSKVDLLIDDVAVSHQLKLTIFGWQFTLRDTLNGGFGVVAVLNQVCNRTQL
ncbi:Uncharacterised protein [Vibrio cholerae]|nr:Uncharacterised protein [Vibrio cholerae]